MKPPLSVRCSDKIIAQAATHIDPEQCCIALNADECQLLALFGHASCRDQCPVSGAKQK
jgi:hypothetical protein